MSAQAAVPGGGNTSSRILDAVLRVAEATGLHKLSMDEIARAGRIGRATLYLHFPGRDAVVKAAVERELARYFERVTAAVEPFDDPEVRLVRGFAAGYRELRDHRALQTVLRTNPDVIRPYFMGPHSPAMDRSRDFIESLLRGENLPESMQPAFAEHIARAIHSLVLTPGGVLGIDAPDGPENYARNFLVPVLRAMIADGAVDVPS
ncbi:TetR/AcrR family transcriptional regulator [Mycolicibacterium brumae]|nr:TetR/AcrR family transcriptional regulator [Mycolicibacterium brumae]MCV7191860.1 TetR/AcrR family transcriptional regulator [Mycolicibacterium brumae]UWW07166.1 TetR/AcrR family transcriptional regulator [Mycolicibacterium brumae]